MRGAGGQGAPTILAKIVVHVKSKQQEIYLLTTIWVVMWTFGFLVKVTSSYVDVILRESVFVSVPATQKVEPMYLEKRYQTAYIAT